MQLPLDIIRYIASFLNLKELCCTEQADKDFHLPIVKRRQIFKWSLKRIKLIRKYSDGKCVIDTCNRQRCTCISFNPMSTRTLSHYCTSHSREYRCEPVLIL